jgi:CheY-like chemotaxis protein
MNGNVWIDSLPGNGCTFSFTACFGLPGEQSSVHHTMPTCGTAYPLSGSELVRKHGARPVDCLRILLVDDDPLNRRLAELVLEKEGCYVETAINAETALDALQRERFDVVLMDIEMPEIDGVQATREIRQREISSGGEPVLVFALTASETLPDQRYCLESGMNGFLKKPIQPGDLFALIRTMQAKPEEKRRPLVLNEHALMDSVGGEETLLAEIIDLFLVHSDKLMKRARESLAAPNQSQFEHIMHTMKGMFQCLFANAGECVARDLQDLVAVDRRVEMFEQLEKEVALLKVVLIRLKRKARMNQVTGKLRTNFSGNANIRKRPATLRSTGGYWHA